MIVEVDRSFPYTRYVYRLPVMVPIEMTRDYTNKSLEEIRDQYGSEVAAGVYWSACHGNDLTKKVNEPNMPVKEVINVGVVHTQDRIELYLLSNEYNQATEDLNVFVLTMAQPLEKELIKNILQDELSNIQQGRIRGDLHYLGKEKAPEGA